MIRRGIVVCLLLLLVAVTVEVRVRGAGHDLADAEGSDEGNSSELHCDGCVCEGWVVKVGREKNGLWGESQCGSWWLLLIAYGDGVGCWRGNRQEAVGDKKECLSGVLLKGGRW